MRSIAFDKVKTTIAKEVVLAYPDFTKPFDIYTDASTKQSGSVITQDKRPIAFFSRKLSGAQSKYTVTELELLAIVNDDDNNDTPPPPPENDGNAPRGEGGPGRRWCRTTT